MASQQENSKNIKAVHEQTERHLKRLESREWPVQIEEAKDDKAKLANICTLYDEEGLTFLSSWLNWLIVREDYSSGLAALQETIVDTFLARDDLNQRINSSSMHLNSIFEGRLLLATELYTEETGKKFNIEFHFDLLQRLHKVQIAAFRTMKDGLKQGARRGFYTTAPVIEGKTVKSHLNDGVDLRQVLPCPIRVSLREQRQACSRPALALVRQENGHDTEPFKASAKLALLFAEVEEALSNVQSAENTFKSHRCENHDEKRHAERMIEYIHYDNSQDANYYCGDTLNKLIANQEKRRIVHQSRYNFLALALSQFNAKLHEFLRVFQDSVKETEGLLPAERSQHFDRDRMALLIRIINNCLAADSYLRRYAREQKRVDELLRNSDIGGGARNSLYTRMQELQKDYAPAVRRRRELLNAEKAGKQN